MYLGARCGFRISNAFLMLKKQTLGVLGASESSSLHSEVRRAWCARCQPLFGLGKAGVTPSAYIINKDSPMTSVANTVAMTTLAVYTLQPHTSFSARQALRRRSQPKRGRCSADWRGRAAYHPLRRAPPAAAGRGRVHELVPLEFCSP